MVLARCRLHFWSRAFVVALTDNSVIFAQTSKFECFDLHLWALIYQAVC